MDLGVREAVQELVPGFSGSLKRSASHDDVPSSLLGEVLNNSEPNSLIAAGHDYVPELLHQQKDIQYF